MSNPLDPIMASQQPPPPTAGRDSVEALDLIIAAWEEGTESGIAPEMMAYAALYAGLSDLVGAYGETHVAAMAERLAFRIRNGEFTHYTLKQ